jgi:nucleoside recognition membrane protein YjiH
LKLATFFIPINFGALLESSTLNSGILFLFGCGFYQELENIGTLPSNL